jgi:hypothetical protein
MLAVVLGLACFWALFLGLFGGRDGARRARDCPNFRLVDGLLLFAVRLGNRVTGSVASKGMRRRIFVEEGLMTRELVVLGVKLVAVVLALWFCHQTLPERVKEIVGYVIGSRITP